MDTYYLITGHNANAPGSSYLTYDQVLNSSNVTANLIPKNNISFAIPNPGNWVKGKAFSSYTEENNSNSYTLYNNNVYLCISNNTNNVENVSNSSNYAPSHTLGYKKYGDGHTWLYLCKITSSVSSLISAKFIPAPSVYELKNLIYNQESDTIICNGSTGTCAIYLHDSGSTASLIFSDITGCTTCSDIAKETTKTDLLTTKFFEPNDTIPSTISLFDWTTSLENAIESGKINAKLNFLAYNYLGAKNSGISSGAILGATINLSAINAQQILDGATNSYLNISSSESSMSVTGGTAGGTGSQGGTGAKIEFITSIAGTTYSKIIGINLTQTGKGYISGATVLLPNISSSAKRQALINNIELIKTPPSLTFTKINSIFDVASQNSIGEDRVVNIINTTPDAATSLNFYGIVKTDQVHGIKSTINNLCPAKLRIYPLTSHGSIANKELINIKFHRAIENDEQI